MSGGASQFTELRVGHRDINGNFVNPTVTINGGADQITGRSIVNDRAVLPEAQEHIPVTENIRALRAALNTLGDGFVVSGRSVFEQRPRSCGTGPLTPPPVLARRSAAGTTLDAWPPQIGSSRSEEMGRLTPRSGRAPIPRLTFASFDKVGLVVPNRSNRSTICRSVIAVRTENAPHVVAARGPSFPEHRRAE